MEDYIKGNKAAWEEAFDRRDESWGRDIVTRLTSREAYAFFYEDMADVLKRYDMKGKSIAQFCCNNGRELLSLVNTVDAAEGIGFDIAENQIAFANEKADELGLPCTFIARNILDIGDEYQSRFDAVIITIGALCWFKDLNAFFKVVSNCMKNGAVIIIHEQHPNTNMLAAEGDPEYDADHPMNINFSYFEREWTGNDGMYYVTKKSYESKTFTDYTHPMSDIVTAICNNNMVITGMKEYEYDIGGSFEKLDNMGFPLSMILAGEKQK